MSLISGYDAVAELCADTPHASLEQQLTESPHLAAVKEHYRDTIDDYSLWSSEGNLHFGYWRAGISPMNRRTMLAELNRQVFNQLHLSELSSGAIADLGCGVGAVSRSGSVEYPQLTWHAMNISDHQIRKAHEFAGNERITYHCADYHQLPFDDCSLSGAFFMESLCYSVAPGAVIAEVARVLRPGAKLVITDGFLRRPLAETSQFFQRLFGRVSSDWAVPAYHDIRQSSEWAMSAGLKLEQVRDLGWRIAPSVLHSIPLTAYCAIKLFLRGQRSRWRWRQLTASGLSLLLGLQRHNFTYAMLTFGKPV